MPKTSKSSPKQKLLPNEAATSSGDSRPSTSGSRPKTSGQSALSTVSSSAQSRGSTATSQGSRPVGSAENAGSRPPTGTKSRRGKGRAARQRESSRNLAGSEIPLSPVGFLSNKLGKLEERDGQDLWKKARGLKVGIRIIAGKSKVTNLITTLREKLANVKDMLSDLDEQKGMTEILGAVPDSLPEFNVDDGTASRGLHRKNETLYAGERFKFCYNPIDEHERYLPGVGVRAVKSYRGVLCELLGDPRNREERGIWQRRLRIESAIEANGPQIASTPIGAGNGMPRLRRSSIAAAAASQRRASPRLPQPLSAREATPSRASERGPVLAFPGATKSFDRELKRLHNLRALAAPSGSKRNLFPPAPPAS